MGLTAFSADQKQENFISPCRKCTRAGHEVQFFRGIASSTYISRDWGGGLRVILPWCFTPMGRTKVPDPKMYKKFRGRACVAVLGTANRCPRLPVFSPPHPRTARCLAGFTPLKSPARAAAPTDSGDTSEIRRNKKQGRGRAPKVFSCAYRFELLGTTAIPTAF